MRCPLGPDVFPVLGHITGALPINNAAQPTTLHEQVGWVEIRVHEHRSMVLAHDHAIEGHFWGTTKMAREVVVEVDFAIERASFFVWETVIVHRASDGVCEAIWCVVWDFAQLGDTVCEVVCKPVTFSVGHAMHHHVKCLSG